MQRWVGGGRDERAFEGAGRGKSKSQLQQLEVPVLGGEDVLGLENVEESESGDGLGGILGGVGGAGALSRGKGKMKASNVIESGD